MALRALGLLITELNASRVSLTMPNVAPREGVIHLCDHSGWNVLD